MKKPVLIANLNDRQLEEIAKILAQPDPPKKKPRPAVKAKVDNSWPAPIFYPVYDTSYLPSNFRSRYRRRIKRK